MHGNVLRNLYDDILRIYDEHHRSIENDITDIDVKYKDDMKLFMSILRKLYYHEINKSNSLSALIDLCNIHHKYYGLPVIKRKAGSHTGVIHNLRKSISRTHKSYNGVGRHYPRKLTRGVASRKRSLQKLNPFLLKKPMLQKPALQKLNPFLLKKPMLQKPALQKPVLPTNTNVTRKKGHKRQLSMNPPAAAAAGGGY
jgi:hypothetical protein